MPDHVQPAPLIWINAFLGTGKYTIASNLANELMEERCTLIHNHDLIDAVTLPREHPMYRTSRKEERTKAFKRHVLAPETRGRCVVFTGMLKWH
jgi:tRNA uridine 5-carbamoylmethylation protein Kti12